MTAPAPALPDYARTPAPPRRRPADPPASRAPRSRAATAYAEPAYTEPAYTEPAYTEPAHPAVAYPDVVPSLREALGRPASRSRALGRPHWPFVVLLLVLLVAGLVGMLLLNTALAQGSFRLHDLQTTSSNLDDTNQALSRRVDELSDPGSLAQQAAKLGMKPGGDPLFARPGAPLPKGSRFVFGDDGEELIVVPGRGGQTGARLVR